MEYKFRDIEEKWQREWKEKKVYNVSNDSPKPKYYVLDMFPYPSGAGLHVGHPLGYIASDIYARYKRLKGFNVLHPMGYDAFGLPAEQYAIEHGIHPAISTAANIDNFRRQLDKIGFCYDWDREVNTSKPEYYRWTQWIFLQLFNSYYNRGKQKAESITQLIKLFEQHGSAAPGIAPSALSFTPQEWKAFDNAKKQTILMDYRLAYCGYGEVNWCEALGTVLANDEVVNGVSERGGHPVVKKKLRQWYLRITEYADRLLEGLERVEFSEAMKEMQSNWIGKSYGAEIDFAIKGFNDKLRVYTTRPDTIFGVDFMVVAPEHELVDKIKSGTQVAAVDEYVTYVKSRSERERMAEKKITGCFTGAYAINPFDGREIPIWISEYVLAGYGTGAIMAVPCGDERDFKFAKHFNIPITNIIGAVYNGEEANATKDAILQNSGFLNGMLMRDAIDVVNNKIEEMSIGKKKVNYKMRDAAFSRQRYWGEPFPIVWKGEAAYALDESELPVELPHMNELKPGEEAEGPLWNLHEWKNYKGGVREVNTMPGYAGSSWYFLRYMDPHNDKEFCSRKASDYWGQVDLYIGGTEHAVGHLLYSRMWTKALYDLGYIGHDEPYKKLVNQGMITGISELAYRFHSHHSLDTETSETIEVKTNLFPYRVQHKDGNISMISMGSKTYSYYFSADCVMEKQKNDMSLIHIPIKFVNNNILNIEELREEWKDEDIVFVTKNGFNCEGKWYNWDQEEMSSEKFVTISQSEKMSKRYQNVVNPDDIIDTYGADTFRMYEMFLGPVEMSKPWDTKGIEGVHRFLKKLWRLFYDEVKGQVWTSSAPSPKERAGGEAATDAEWKALYKGLKKIEEDTERFSFNTGVSTFMILVNELSDLKCHKKEVLEKLLIALAPYAPHIAEELWSLIHSSPGGGDREGTGTILDAAYPTIETKYLIESSKEYPISINGKMRTTINIALDASQPEVEQIVLANEVVQKWLEGKTPKKIIFVKGKMVNVVV
ncbi:MAG TPA: class I tRNA ligase family protein [Chitinophagaceae bacterium]|nr:class I tRNA ligase family protein [Chitinophagaceae bacterium]